MKAIEYRLRLIEPMLVAQAGAGEENSAVGLDYIPGSAIRGALAARWLGHNRGADLAEDSAARAFFLDHIVYHLNAYPVCKDARSLPMPASWFTEKESADDSDAIIYDFALDFSSEGQLGATKPPSGGHYCRISREKFGGLDSTQPWVCLIEPDRFDQVHITLDDVNKRGEGNLVFRYEALAAGQLYAGAIVAPDEIDLKPILDLLLQADLHIGSAHMAGYGRIQIENCELRESYHEYETTSPSDDTKLVVTLLSHAIIRSKEGQTGWDGGKALAHELGCAPDVVPELAFGKTMIAGGYNRKWSLPLIQDWALTAGSAFVFKSSQIDHEKLQLVIDQGLGERRSEGFGRIAAGWQSAPRLLRQQVQPSILIAPNLAKASVEAAQKMAQRRLRLILDRALIQRIYANAGRASGPLPSNSQLSAIRQVALQGLADHNMEKLKDYLKNLKSAGKKQLVNCRVGSQTLFDWILQRADRLDVQEQLLEHSNRQLPKMAGIAAALNDELRVEYTSRLIDGTMQQMAKGKEK